MDTRLINGSASAARSISLLKQPDYSSKPVQEALKHLAYINLRELCNEAKIERCRATRDLASCGRFVNYVLNPCGHASLCTECCQRCDVCPICRSPLPKTGDKLRLRLYYECVEAGLISRTNEEASEDSDEDGHQLTADVLRLYSLFDVAMNNNLISVVCHYITNVCMDETAVSSDPVIAFLLDEVVVKDWVKRTFRSILADLQEIYTLETKEMQAWLDNLLKCSKQVACICSVLEVMESAFKGSVSSQLQDVQKLRENIGKTKQHLDIMVWCIRHGFLDDVRSRYSNFTSWNALVLERKSNAIKRAWPDAVDQSSDCNVQGASLFIEDALENLEREPEYGQEIGADLEVGCLQKDKRSFLRSKIEGTSGSYPFENLRTAADILFLHGGSDLVVAKQAIFLYYLFDRHWTTPEKYWKHIIDDFAATFGITRHSLLESFVFYLLDDHSEEALQETCRILPEICGPETYPKVAQVLLERENPETALMVLRWSGRDGVSEMVSIGEAVTAIRVRVECGLLSEAFTYQRTLCLKVKENKLKNGAVKHVSDDPDSWSWTEWMEILVNEFCCLSIRRNLVDRIIELPWNPNEEKYLHRCLLDSATDDPSSAVGSLLVVFYLQRYRYIQAYQVDLKLQKIEDCFLSDIRIGEEVMFRMQSQIRWRKELVDRSIDILPVIQQQQVRSGQFSEMEDTSDSASEGAKISNLPDAPEMITSSVPVSNNSVFLQRANNADTREPVASNGSPFQPGHLIGNASLDISHGRLFTSANRGQKSEVRSTTKALKFGEVSTPFKDLNRARGNSQLKGKRTEETSPETNIDRFMENNMSSPYLRRVTANNPVTVKPSSNHLNRSAKKPESTFFGTRMQPDRDNFNDLDDPMDMSSSFKHNTTAVATESRNNSGGLRWRSDETSEEEDELNLGMEPMTNFGSMQVKGRRRRRFAAR
ncbi:PREDICTED: E3 ubiquitin-protein ligase HOS1-like [Camelina sativa]|uniref:E3 ubiquitin-protein ligase HOS1-like n=1 Tax=Camelina sativa TaxID=90675 RepID=A0ABM0Z150_CAMSA|nr:PREDICTED: E3 ubiquitin-protein ligase HOS1-like [Camelina sativa]